MGCSRPPARRGTGNLGGRGRSRIAMASFHSTVLDGVSTGFATSRRSADLDGPFDFHCKSAFTSLAGFGIRSKPSFLTMSSRHSWRMVANRGPRSSGLFAGVEMMGSSCFRLTGRRPRNRQSAEWASERQEVDRNGSSGWGTARFQVVDQERIEPWGRATSVASCQGESSVRPDYRGLADIDGGPCAGAAV